MATDYSNSPLQKSTSPASTFVPVSASATAFANGPCRGIYVGVTGNITITDRQGNSVQFVGIAAGVIHPIQAVAITAASATSIVLAY